MANLLFKVFSAFFALVISLLRFVVKVDSADFALVISALRFVVNVDSADLALLISLLRFVVKVLSAALALVTSLEIEVLMPSTIALRSVDEDMPSRNAITSCHLLMMSSVSVAVIPVYQLYTLSQFVCLAVVGIE